jgi:hypothetical protein
MSTTKPVDTPLSTEDAAGQMAHYGIRCVPVDYFHFREFRSPAWLTLWPKRNGRLRGMAWTSRHANSAAWTRQDLMIATAAQSALWPKALD